MLLVELIKTKYLIGIGKRNNDLWGVKAVLNVQQIVCDSCLVNFYSVVTTVILVTMEIVMFFICFLSFSLCSMMLLIKIM